MDREKGLIRQLDGTYNLRSSILWLEKYYRNSAKPIVKFDWLEQQQLVELFGVKRQTIAAWVRSGLLRWANKSDDLRTVTHWMRRYYQDLAAKEYKCRLGAIPKTQKKSCTVSMVFVEWK